MSVTNVMMMRKPRPRGTKGTSLSTLSNTEYSNAAVSAMGLKRISPCRKDLNNMAASLRMGAKVAKRQSMYIIHINGNEKFELKNGRLKAIHLTDS